MLDIDESAVDITFNPTVESTFAAPKEIDETAGISCGGNNQSLDESVANDVTVMDKTAPISEDDDDTGQFLVLILMLKPNIQWPKKMKLMKHTASPLAPV